MKDATELGFNRTGVQTSPLALHIMQTYADEQTSMPPAAADGMPDGKAIAAVRSAYVLEADGVGSVPMPGTLTGAFNTVISKLRGQKPEVLVDKLGERLGFERSGVRLYQALIDKTEALAGRVTLPFTPDDLRHIRDEELEHMHIVASALDSLGADSSAQTPSADVAAVANGGVMQVMTDPRTTISQCLEAMLSAELLDSACWALLIRLSKEADQDALLPQFQRALKRENEHVTRVKGWLETMLLGEMG
ncbi:MAG TPA: ferritin-like domain-containing protein [Aromatoleum sp.]|uniref:ferritin-like domain-containing protein n=1 Tax=Aromatoleum sp. TaxID=2307007 RepID=UPI002B488A78|nr:ferritin-like domain-containing protein [Aromatoleum sp.]HJV24685.1 ferritin-like domain-containing protein [Aromatoleum sp.]